MTTYHKHTGVESKGVLKSHPVEQKHKDPQVQKFHNLAIKGVPAPPAIKPTPVKSVPQTNDKVRIPGVTFEGGFVMVDMEQFPSDVKGARIKLVRQEGKKSRTIGIEFLRR